MKIRLKDAKATYNRHLDKYKRAERWLDDCTIPEGEREKYIPKIREYANNLGFLINLIETYVLNRAMTDDEKLNGFLEERRLAG
jgi:hypothetical protein